MFYYAYFQICADLLKRASKILLLSLSMSMLLACGAADQSASDDFLNIGIDVGPVPDIEVKPSPKGIFNSAGGLKSANSPPIVREQYNGVDYVSGSLVRIGWDLVHQGPGVFDLSLIDRELEEAAKYNTSINLVIQDTKAIPSFVLNECENFVYYFAKVDENITTCLPWNERYQFYKNEIISELGKRYDDNPQLASIYFTYSAMTNGIEMHWRISNSEESAFIGAGYTQDKLVTAYNNVMDMYANAFQKTPVIMEIHAVFNDSFLADRGFAHCYEKLGARCGVGIWWCSEMNALGAEAKVWPVAQLASSLSFSVCQTVGNFTNEPDRFEDGTSAPRTSLQAMEEEMAFFLKEGVTVFEIWTEDLDNPNLANTLSETSALIH